MNIRDSLLAALIASSVFAIGTAESATTEAKDHITILYDAFGTNEAMTRGLGIFGPCRNRGKAHSVRYG